MVVNSTIIKGYVSYLLPTWDFPAIEPHLYVMRSRLFGQEGGVELSVTTVLHTTRYGSVVNHDL